MNCEVGSAYASPRRTRYLFGPVGGVETVSRHLHLNNVYRLHQDHFSQYANNQNTCLLSLLISRFEQNRHRSLDLACPLLEAFPTLPITCASVNCITLRNIFKCNSTKSSHRVDSSARQCMISESIKTSYSSLAVFCEYGS